MFSLKKLVKLGLGLGILAVLALLALYFSMRSELPSVESLKDLKWQTPMQIYSQDGKLISQFGEKKRIPLTLEEMPKQLINAVLATEDDRFYNHFGVDPIGVGRAVFGKLIGQNKGGASTITMQVARNFFLTREQTYTRKIREVFLAFHIENLLTKDEILALYMNKIELGHRAFGFGAAAQVYYGKEVKELTLPQIAVLAGLPKAPSTLNPIRSPARAKERRSVVLQRMLVSGYITETEYKDANTAPITGKKHGAEIELNAPYIAEMAHQKMLEKYGAEEAYTGGYKVFLTTPAHLQLAAQKAVIENLLNYDKRHGYRGPIRRLRDVIEKDDSDDTATTSAAPPVVEEITEIEITDALAQISSVQSLKPAVVTQVLAQSAIVALSIDEYAEIPWHGMNWAREYISDQKQGAAPKTASDILAVGDVIWVRSQGHETHLSQMPQVSSALVAMSPDDGAIKAIVGGFSFKQSQFNRATHAKRQVGSNIKPFIYSAALENGFTLASLVNDAPINQWDKSSGVVWRPKNSPPRYDGPIRVKVALAQSKNVVAVRLLRAVGLDKMVNHLSSFGFVPDELPRNESLALGSASLTPLEVATGFSTFANGGFLVDPYLIERIEDSFGNVVFQANPALACDPCTSDFPLLSEQAQPEPNTIEDNNLLASVESASALQETSTPISGLQSNNLQASTIQNSRDQLEPIRQAERVLNPQNAFLITEALNEAIWGADWSRSPGWQGTGFRGRVLKRRDIGGKTGTTNEAKDAWFSGFSRRMVATSWIGFDDHRRNLGQTSYNRNLDKTQTTGKEFGAKSAQPAWIYFMKTALAELPVEDFEPPEQIVSVRIDKETGKLTNKTDRSSLFEYFKSGTAPAEYISEDTSATILDGEESEDEIF